jgi:hypothetical protein
MAFVSGFDYDVFISYCHVDNMVTSREKHGWVTRFQNDLNIRLAQRVGKLLAIKLWWDKREIDGGQLFDESIERAVRASAVFLALCSPSYLESNYCIQELRCFAEKVARERTGAAIGDRSRIIPVLLYKILYEKWPREFPKVSGFEFFRTKDPSKLDMPCAPDSEDFDARLSRLADSIVSLLHALRSTLGVQAETPTVRSLTNNESSLVVPAESGSGFESAVRRRIFVADVPDGLRLEQSQLLKQLSEDGEDGVEVLSEIPPPYESRLHDERVKAAMHGLFASIHLFDGSLARPIEGDVKATYPQRQLLLALRSSAAQIVWVPSDKLGEPDPVAIPPGYGSESQKKSLYSLIYSHKNDLVRRITETVGVLVQRENERQAATTVLLDFHSKDFQYALQVNQQCRESGLRTLAGPDADDPKANIRLFTQRLRKAGTIVIAFGRVSEIWVRQRINAALQTIVTGDCPTKQLVIYLAPPPKAAFSVQPRVGNIVLSVVDRSRDFDRSLNLGEHIMKAFSSGRP